jgi:hypothetical protein
MSSIAGPALFACFVAAQFAAVVVISRMHRTAGTRAEDGARGASGIPREPIWRGNERGGVVTLAQSTGDVLRVISRAEASNPITST